MEREKYLIKKIRFCKLRMHDSSSCTWTTSKSWGPRVCASFWSWMNVLDTSWLCAGMGPMSKMDPPSPVPHYGTTFLGRDGTVSAVKCEVGKECLSSVRNQSRGRAKEGSGFQQSLICWVPQENLAANLGLWAMEQGNSSTGGSRHIWKQTSGLRLQPVCQVWCVSGKACCEDHNPQDCGGESGKKQMTEKTCFSLFLLAYLFTWPPRFTAAFAFPS